MEEQLVVLVVAKMMLRRPMIGGFVLSLLAKQAVVNAKLHKSLFELFGLVSLVILVSADEMLHRLMIARHFARETLVI